MRIVEIIVEGYREARVKFQQDPQYAVDQGEKYVELFRDLVNRNQIRDPRERNIDYWAKQGYREFRKFVSQFLDHKSATQARRSPIQGNEIILKETDHWLIVIPLNMTSSCFHGKTTNWCVAKPGAGHFENYFYNHNITLVYFIQKNTGDLWALAVARTNRSHDEYNEDEPDINPGLDPNNGKMFEIWNKDNKPITSQEFYTETGFIAEDYANRVLQPEYLRATDDARAVYHRKGQRLANLMLDLTRRSPSARRSPTIENLIFELQDRDTALKYIHWITEKAPQDMPPHLVTLALQSRESEDETAAHFLKNITNVKAQSLYTALKASPHEAQNYIINYFLTVPPSDQTLKKMESIDPGFIISYMQRSNKLTPELIQEVLHQNPVAIIKIMDIMPVSEDFIIVAIQRASEIHDHPHPSIHPSPDLYEFVNTLVRKIYSKSHNYSEKLAAALMRAVRKDPKAVEKILRYLLLHGPISKKLAELAYDITNHSHQIAWTLAYYAYKQGERILDYENIIASDPKSAAMYKEKLNP